MVSTATTTEYRHNIIADGEVIAVHTIDQSGNAYTDYLHYDQLGSVDAITDDQGTVIQSMSFDAFGQRRDPNNWDYDLSQNTISTLKAYTDRGYTDQEQLDNLSLVDLNGRVYDPTVGRFISADPTVPDPFYSQAFNRYSYVYNSPLEYTDPSGLCPAKMLCEWFPTGPNGSYQEYTVGALGGSGNYTLLPAIDSLANDNIIANNMAAEVASIDIAVASTFIADNSTGMTTLAAPVSTGGIASVPSGGLASLPPLSPTQCECNIGGDNQVGNSMAGWQLCGAGCFAFVGMASTPSFDPQEHFDPMSSRDAQLAARQAAATLPRAPGVGPMLPARPMLGTMGRPTPVCGPCSPYRYTQPGESFIRYESNNPAFSKVTSEGGLAPDTYAAPSGEGLLPQSSLNAQYNLPSPWVLRTNAYEITPPAGTPIIGPRPVAGGFGNEVVFPFGAPPGSVGPVMETPVDPLVVEPVIVEPPIIIPP